MDKSANKSSFLVHLEELRKRLIRSLLILLCTTGLAAFFVDKIFSFLILPVQSSLPVGKKLVVLSPMEPILVYLKIAILTGFLLAVPLLLYQFWRFISPGLYAHEKKYILPFISVGTILFFAGTAFGFFVFLPITFRFLVSMTPEQVSMEYTVEQYFTMITHLLFAIGLVFELPLILATLALLGVVSVQRLSHFRKYAIVLAFVVSAIITPTVDPYSQVLMALPLILFYEIGILAARLLGKKPAK